MKKAILSILLCTGLFVSAQNLSVKREGGKFYSDAFVHEASELYDWHIIENTLAKNVNSNPAKCNDFFNFIFKSGLVSMNEYLELVQNKKITKDNALQYWIDKLPLFEKLYTEKYVPITTHPVAANAKQGSGSSVQSGGANCNNLDFYTNTTAGWTGQWNNAGGVTGGQVYGALTVNGMNSSLTDRWGYVHELCTTGQDRNVPINTTAPGHGVSLRLGNDSAYQILQSTGNQPLNLPFNHQIISNTFMVTQLNKAVTYWYAVVLCQYNPNNHASNIQPYFKIRLYDASGNEIMCAHYDVDALSAPTIGGFLTQSNAIWDPNQQAFVPYDFFYKDWSQVMIPLQNYVGQNVTITFETSDCAGGGHPGYAYVTADCAPMPNITITPFACGSSGTTATLSGPAGAGSYSWAGPGIVSGGNSQVVTVNTAGSYTVTMTTLGNSGFNCTFSVDTVIGPPPPAATASFTANSGCMGAPIQFTDQSNANGGTIVGWNWNFGDGTTSTAFNPTHSYTTAVSPVTVSYTITTAAGCVDTYTAPVILFPPAVPQFTANTVCVGNPTIFNNNQSQLCASYQWNFGDGSTSNSSNPSHTYSSAGVYNVTLTGTSAQTCTAAISVQVTVKPQPVAAGSAPIACLGTSTSFNNSSVYSGTGSFSWNFGDGTTTADTSNLQTPSYSYPSAGVYTVSLGVTSGPGCSATTTFTVLVSPLPAVTVTQPQPYCPGANVASPVLTSTPSTGVNYSWSNNNTAIGLYANGTGVPPPFIAGSNTSASTMIGVITITPSLNGCVGPPCFDTIKIQTAPIVAQSAIELCPNSVSGAINFVTIPAGVPATVVWTNTTPGNYIGLNQNSGAGSIPTFITIDPGTGTQSIIISVAASLNGCNGPSSTFPITVNPNPVATFTHTTACEGNTTQFTDQSTVAGGGSITQWHWDLDNNGLYNDAASPNAGYIFPTAGTYTVSLQVVSSKGCKNITSQDIVVNPSPKVNIFGDVLSGCPVHTVNFTDSATVAAPQHIVSYDWYFGNGTTWHNDGPVSSSFTNVSHTANAYYTISLTVVSDLGCVGSAVKANYITVYPTPVAAFTWNPQDADILDPTIHFYDQSIGSGGANPILWYLGDTYASNDEDNYTTEQNPIHKYSELQEGIYHVTQWVENQYGCRDSVSNNIVIHPAFTFYAPNAFTPGDMDGMNDGFKGTGIGIDNSTYKMWIYDRWGNLVWESHDLELAWDGRIKGKPVMQDTYVWKVEFNDMRTDFHQYKGVVNLIR